MNELARQIFDESIKVFFVEERENIINNVAERNLCGRLAIYLSHALSNQGVKGYFADTEYNRKQGGQVKTIILGKEKIVTIQADLIVHTRGKIIDGDNFIAIEMKKSSRPEFEKTSDRERLLAMTTKSYDGVWSSGDGTHPEHVCDYKLGVYIILDIKAKTFILEFYQLGALIDVNKGEF
jgi:hypothetical protein